MTTELLIGVIIGLVVGAASVGAVAFFVLKPRTEAEYEKLAADIDAVYTAAPLAERLQAFLDRKPPAELEQVVSRTLAMVQVADQPLPRLQAIGQLMAGLHTVISQLDAAQWRMAALDLGISVESDFFAEAARLRDAPDWLRQSH